MIRLSIAACASLGLVLLAGEAQAAQWIVDDDGPADFRTIQQAADSPLVAAGDTLLVRPGRYVGNVLLDLRDLVVVSEAGPRVTVLDGDASGSVVSLYQRSGLTRVEGFTITGGRGSTGGGVWIYEGDPVVTRNIIEGNSAIGGFLGYGFGGGIEIYASAAVVTRNVIRGNTARDGGGGIDVYYAGPGTPGACCPVIAQNTIVGNRLTTATGVGGGILVSASSPLISSNILAGNEAAAGGGLYVEKLPGNNDTPGAEVNLLHANLPDEASSNVNWHLPSSNRIVDPRLGSGPGLDLWPRSDSPALDGAAAGLPAWIDMTGGAAAEDSDLDGMARGDIGALEGRGDISGLHATDVPGSPGAALLTWDGAINPAVLFDLYRDENGRFTSAAAACVATALPALSWIDAAIPPVGSAYHYLVAGGDAAAGGFGLRSDMTPRTAPAGCYP